MEGKIFACFGRKYLLWCGVNAAGEAAANVQGESLNAAAVISNGDIELPGALLNIMSGRLQRMFRARA